MLSLLLSIFFGYSQGQCDICSWPYSAGVNSKGECYLLYSGSVPAFQGGLESGCYLYCDAWARQLSTQQPASPMLSFSQGAGGVSCQCQRLNSSGDVEYKSRPTGSCDWGYSDQLQSYYDSLAVNHRSSSDYSSGLAVSATSAAKTVSQVIAWKDSKSLSYHQDPTYAESYNIECTKGDASSALEYRHQFWNIDPETGVYSSDGPQTLSSITLPVGYTCEDHNNGAMYTKTGQMTTSTYARLLSHDTALARLDAGIQSLQKSNASSQSTILDALEKLQAKPTGGGGGLNPTDLSGVFAAIDSSKMSILRGQKDLSDSLSGLKSLFSARMLSLEGKTDTLALNLSALTDSVSSLRMSVDELGKSTKSVGDSIHKLDSAMAARHKADRERDSLAYQSVLDSLGGSGASMAEAQSQVSELQSLSDEGESHRTDALSNIQRIQNLSGCSEVPVLTADLGSLGLGVVSINLAHYSYVVGLSRFLFRFLGGFAALLLVLGALRVLAIPSNGR